MLDSQDASHTFGWVTVDDIVYGALLAFLWCNDVSAPTESMDTTDYMHLIANTTVCV